MPWTQERIEKARAANASKIAVSAAKMAALFQSDDPGVIARLEVQEAMVEAAQDHQLGQVLIDMTKKLDGNIGISRDEGTRVETWKITPFEWESDDEGFCVNRALNRKIKVGLNREDVCMIRVVSGNEEFDTLYVNFCVKGRNRVRGVNVGKNEHPTREQVVVFLGELDAKREDEEKQRETVRTIETTQ
jgi:hypothetical protein